jgi:hypothetical protein
LRASTSSAAPSRVGFAGVGLVCRTVISDPIDEALRIDLKIPLALKSRKGTVNNSLNTNRLGEMIVSECQLPWACKIRVAKFFPCHASGEA